MKTKHSLVDVMRRWAFVLLFALASVNIAVYSVRTLNEYNTRIKQMRSQYLELERQVIKSEVTSLSRLISHETEKVLEAAKAQVKARVSAALAMAWNLYDQNQGVRTDGEIKKIIIDALRPMRMDRESGYYFVFGFNGIVQLLADRPDQEQISLLNRQNSQGQFVMKDMIHIAKTTGEGFYSYDWTKPGQPGNGHRKLTFVKRFDPFDWLIGTGIYMEDLESAMQETILSYAQTRRFGPGNQGYVFVYELLDIRGGEKFASVYANPNHPGDTGTLLSDAYEDVKGKAFRKEFLKGLREKGECYVDYWYKKMDNTGVGPKTSFFKLSEDGRFIVAAGIYQEDVEEQIALAKAKMGKSLRMGLLSIGGMFMAAMLIVWLLASLLNRRLAMDIKVFEDCFRLAANTSESIDGKRVKFREFARLAEFTNQVLSQKDAVEQDLKQTQARLTQAQEMAGVGHYVFDIQEDRWTNSRELDAIFGIDPAYTRDAAGWLDIVHPDFRASMSDYLQDHVLTRHKKFDKKYKIIARKTGQEKWVHGLGDLCFDGAGNPVEMFGTIQDITEQKIAKDALKNSEARLSGIVNSMADWIWEVDKNGHYTFCSENVDKVFGYRPHEMIGKKPFDFMPPAEAEKIRKIFKEIAAGKQPIRDLENWNIRKDGDKICLLTNGVPILGESGELLGYRGVDRDITRRKQADQERKELEARLRQSHKMEAIGTLAGGIAHDFNNILSGILGYSQLALTHVRTPEKLTRHLEQIIKGVQRASDLTKQILTFSRQSEYQKHTFRIYLEIKEAVKLLRSSIPSTIEIVTRLESRERVLADPIRIHQIVMNLCTNAYQAMRKTGGRLTVSLTDVTISDSQRLGNKGGAPGDYVRLEVSDTGHGMDRQTLAKAFEPYFTTREKGDGTGLGLALVQAIVEEHDGFLEVESDRGTGTRFYLYFPVVKEPTKNRHPERSMEREVSGSERILLIDDEEQIRESAREFLQGLGYQVAAFSNGTDALGQFQKDPDAFDLVISDMTMPGLTGDRVASQILSTRPAMPVILCTGFNGEGSREKAEALGVRRYLQKPVLHNDLAILIRDICDRIN